MQSVLVALVGGLGMALALVAPSGSSKQSDAARRSAEVEACLRGCDAHESSTDRSTCRLQCEEGVQSKREPDVVRWKKTEYYDGLPDGAQKGGSVTTTTERSPLGTTTTTTTTTTTQQTSPRSTGRSKPATPTVSPYAVLAQCQALCDVEQSPTNRATCKLQCLNNPRHRTPRAVTKPAHDPSVEAQCRARCEASEKTPGARATCTHNCVATETARTRQQTSSPKTPTPSKPSTPPAAKRSRKAKSANPKADPAKARACRSQCHRKASACSENCSGEGSNKSTCELQCNQTASRCAERCG